LQFPNVYSYILIQAMVMNICVPFVKKKKMKHEGELVTWFTASLWCVLDETSILDSSVILDENVIVFSDALFRTQKQ